MSNILDSNGNYVIQSGTIFYAADFNGIISYYQSFWSNFTSATHGNTVLYASELNQLITDIQNYASSNNYTVTLPSQFSKGSTWDTSTWGKPVSNGGGLVQKTLVATATSNQTGSFTVDNGVSSITIVSLSAAGGGGGGFNGANKTGGSWAGAGGTGGYYQNQTISVNAGDTISWSVGIGGNGGTAAGIGINDSPGTAGGSTIVYVNGTTAISATGGGPAENGTGSNGGTAGSPNGIAGHSGVTSSSNEFPVGYPYSNATGYGSGGPGGGVYQITSTVNSTGSPGQTGYLEIQYMAESS